MVHTLRTVIFHIIVQMGWFRLNTGMVWPRPASQPPPHPPISAPGSGLLLCVSHSGSSAPVPVVLGDMN